MPPVLTGSFANHLAPGLKAIIGANFMGRETTYTSYYNMGTTNRKFEDYAAATGLPIAVEKPEGVDVQSFDPLESAAAGIGGGPAGTKRLTPKVYAIGAEVSMEAWEDDLYVNNGSAVREVGNGIADSLAERLEIEAHSPFINGFDTTTFTVLPDASAFIATSHASIVGAQGPAQANRPATDVDLNLTSLRASFIRMRKWKNDQGLRIPAFAKPKTLYVTPDFEYDALELLRSTDRPDTANRAVNVTAGMVNVVSDAYLSDETSSDMWLVQAQRHFAEFLWRKRPFFDSFDDRRKRIAIFVGLERFVAQPVHWLGWDGCPGA